MPGWWRSMAGSESDVTCPRCHGVRPTLNYNPTENRGYKIYYRHYDGYSLDPYAPYVPKSPSRQVCTLCNNRRKVPIEKAAVYQLRREKVPDLERRYGAIAISDSRGTYGWSNAYSDEAEAEARACSEAGGGGAKVVIVGYHVYLVLTQGVNGNYCWYGSRDPREATRNALRKAGEGSQVVVAFDTVYGCTIRRCYPDSYQW